MPTRAQAQQIAMITRRESRNPITVSMTCLEEALVLAVGDVVRVTHATPGWVEKKFWVMQMSILPNALVGLILTEYDETAYDLNAQDDTPFAPDTNLHLPRDLAVPVPADFVVSSQVILTPTGGIVELAATYSPPGGVAADFFDHMEYEIQQQRSGQGASWDTIPIRIEQGGSDGTDRIKADWNTEYRVVPVTVSTGGTRTKGTGGLIEIVSTGAQPTATPTIGTPVAYTDRIEYPITFDTSTARIRVWYTNYASNPGTATSRYLVGTPRADDIHRDDGTGQTIAIPLASGEYQVATFVAFDAWDGKGTTTTTGPTQTATPSIPPNITATPTEVSDTETTTTVRNTMPASGLAAGDKIVVYRDGAATGQEVDRTAGAGATQDIVHTGLNPNTTYVWKYKLRNAGGFLSAAFSPELMTTTDAGTIPTPSVALGLYNQVSQSLTVTVTPAGGTPSGVSWHVKHSTDGGAFVDSGEASTATEFDHVHLPDPEVEQTCAVKVYGTKSGWATSADSAASETRTIPEGEAS